VLKKVLLTIDVEHDCPPYLTTTKGMEIGMPKLLDLFQEQSITATFFSTGQMAEKFPNIMRRIVNEGHELGCHGHTHKRFDQMDYLEANDEIACSVNILREYGDVCSFRAPNLSFPDEYLSILVEHGFKVDSSQARYKLSHYFKKKSDSELTRLPVSILCNWFRMPLYLSVPRIKPYKNLVLNMHPWEFVDMSKSGIPFDCRLNTGGYAFAELKKWITYFKKRYYDFLTVST